MKNYLFILLLTSLCVACGGNSNYRSNNGYSDNSETVTEDTYAAQRAGFQNGYNDGYDDGYGWKAHGYSYNDQSIYTTNNGIRAYKNGYNEGYDEGYSKGENLYLAEEEAEKKRDWHNWEDEDVDGIFIKIDCENAEEAQYIASNYYDGEYIQDGFDYYAKITLRWDQYQVTLGRRINSHLYQIQGTDKYIHFKWMADVSWGDEGVLDWSGTFSSFYKKPD